VGEGKKEGVVKPIAKGRVRRAAGRKGLPRPQSLIAGKAEGERGKEGRRKERSPQTYRGCKKNGHPSETYLSEALRHGTRAGAL